MPHVAGRGLNIGLGHLHEVLLGLSLVYSKGGDEHLAEVYVDLHVHIVHRHLKTHATAHGNRDIGIREFA